MSTPVHFDRPIAMGLLARAPSEKLAALLPDLPKHTLIRGPEIGAVMVRGRQGGTGAPFNLGEMTITRCSVKLECGAVGHSHVQGRDKTHACRAAVIDALLQTSAADQIAQNVLARLADDERARRETRARKAAATKVEFFTMVRGED